MKLQTTSRALLMALTASFAMVVVAQAQPASPASAPSPASIPSPTGAPVDPGSTSGVIPWSAIVEKPTANGPDSFDRPGDMGMGIGSTVKEAVRPIRDELSQSGVIQSLREFDSDLGGGNRRRENAGQNSVGYSSGNPLPVAPAKSAQQIKREQQAASGMLDQLIREATPWAAGLMGLLALGFAAKLWMDWLHAKAARPGKLRRSAGRRRSRHSASSVESRDGPQAPEDAPSATGLESSSRRRSSRSSGSSSASSSAPGSSGASSGRRRHRSHRPQL